MCPKVKKDAEPSPLSLFLNFILHVLLRYLFMRYLFFVFVFVHLINGSLLVL